MPESSSLRDRYLELIDQIVQTTLKGQIRSKEQVYQLLIQGIQLGTGEVFEQCLQERVSQTEQQIKTEADEFKQSKASRSFRALKTIEAEWQRWLEQNKASEAISATVQQITTAESGQRLAAFLQAIDPNRENCLNTTQLKQLAKTLQQTDQTNDRETQQDLQHLARGITRGLESWNRLQEHLVSWIYEPGQLGFAGTAKQRDPWTVWAKQLISPLPIDLFQALSIDQPVVEFASRLQRFDLSDWVELILILQYLEQGLIAWFDRLVYDSKVGANLSISVFLAFATIWSQLAQGLQQVSSLNSQHRTQLVDGAFLVTLQILRRFAQRPYFPLYGGIYASFSGQALNSAVEYLNEPLKRTQGTQEKARILTLLGFSERARGRLDLAKEFHSIAREMAADADDRACEIANLNHLSRTFATQKNYLESINYSQRALILSRQTGDRLGEANGLVNLGYSEVLQAQQLERADSDTYEQAIYYLQQGLKLAEQLGDQQSRAFGFNSLGIAQILLDQPKQAITSLAEGLKAAQASGDLYLQGLDLAYLAEAYYRQQELSKAIYAGCLAMYYLERIDSRDWRQPAGLLMILQGQMGDQFHTALATLRPELIGAISVDGYDYIPQLLDQYRRTIE